MYKPPSPEELKDLVHVKLKLSRSEAGGLADVSGGKIGQWSAGKGQMPYSVLATIINRATGKTVTPEDWRDQIRDD